MPPRKGQGRRASGTGSIYQDKDGNWEARIAIGTLPNGKVRYKKHREATERACVAWLKQQLIAESQGLDLAPEKLTVAEHLDRWLSEVKARARYSTHLSYTQLVKDHLKPALGGLQLAKLTRHHVQRLLDELHAAGKARNTIRNVRACGRAATAGCAKTHPLAYAAFRDVTVPRTAPKPPPQRALTPEQCRAFLAAVAGDRLEAIYWTALLLGLRRGEVLGLRICDVDLAAKTLTIAGQRQYQKGKGQVRIAPKSEGSESTVPIPDALIPVLERQLARVAEERRDRRWKDHGLLFPTTRGTAYAGRNVVRSFKRALSDANLPDIRFHDLRHSCASLLVTLNVHPKVMMEILRHSQISTTMEIYAHAVPEVNRAAANAIGALLTAPAPAAPTPATEEQGPA